MKRIDFLALCIIAFHACAPDQSPTLITPTTLEDIYLGATKSFAPLDLLEHGKEAVFVNEQGEEKIFILHVEQGMRNLTNNTQPYNAKYYTITYIDSLAETSYYPSIVLQSKYGDLNRREEEIVVKLFSFGYSFPATIIIKDDGQQLIGQYKGDHTECGITFNSVYTNFQDPNAPANFSKLYYNKAQGIVAFELLEGEMWAFKQVL